MTFFHHFDRSTIAGPGQDWWMDFMDDQYRLHADGGVCLGLHRFRLQVCEKAYRPATPVVTEGLHTKTQIK